MTKKPASINSTLETMCGPLPEAVMKEVKVVVAEYLVRGDARGLRKHLRKTLAAGVPTATCESLAESLASMLQYTASAKRVWKATWETLHGATTSVAAKMYEVSAEDIDLVLTYTTEPTIDVLLATTRDEVLANVDATEVERLTNDLDVHVKRVGRRLRFISMYDPAIDAEDINQDLILKALKTVYNYENMVPWEGTSYHTAMLNKARSAVSSGAFDVIKYHSNPVRSRIVGTYTCDSCACTSDSIADKCEWCGASMEHVQRVTKRTTWVAASGRLIERVACGLNGEAEAIPARDTQDQYIDLAADLLQHMDPHTREYLCCLLRESQGFDAWLADTHAHASDDLSDIGIRQLAANYVGQPRKRLDRKLQQAAKKARIR